LDFGKIEGKPKSVLFVRNSKVEVKLIGGYGWWLNTGQVMGQKL
jgi:hypothetical protein